MEYKSTGNYIWRDRTAYLVQCNAKVLIEDSGSTNPALNVRINDQISRISLIRPAVSGITPLPAGLD